MPYNLVALGAAIGPDVVETFFSHYLKRSGTQDKPTKELSYHEGLRVIRRFLYFASHHTVEEIQGFTSPFIPHPPYVRIEGLSIPRDYTSQANEYFAAQVGQHGIDRIGGPTWWQWRSADAPPRADWIETRRDYNARVQGGGVCKRNILYIHGGAYFFGSVDEHRYQMIRYARKLQARIFAPRYRLAPQYPFPAGLVDCLAAYLYLLSVQDPSTILLSGDSAGGGMVVALLTLLRDQGLPLPAGAILLSPWVDLTHSFPSLSGDGAQDYVPAHGFIHRPSMAWPPPNSDDMKDIDQARAKSLKEDPERAHRLREKIEEVQKREEIRTEAQGFTSQDANGAPQDASNSTNKETENLSIEIDGKLIEIKDQIQLYTTNALLTHPLVSPVLTPSLGGLPPLLIMVGGGELLRDEQIYLAHKAANPSKYPLADVHLDAMPDPAAARESMNKWPPTNVQLQVWDNLCHVAPTLSFTRPAKCMYRSAAQFGAFALSRAQQGADISIPEDYDTSDDESSDEETAKANEADGKHRNLGVVGKAGDQIPPFHNHMVRQRVTRRGDIYPLEAASQLPACNMAPEAVGVIKEGPVRKWMEVQKEWARRYGKIKRRVQERRLQEVQVLKSGPMLSGERPPPTSAVWRKDLPKEANGKFSRLLAMWSGWGGKHDEDAIVKEEMEEGLEGRGGEEEKVEPALAATTSAESEKGRGASRQQRARFRSVSYAGQFQEEGALAMPRIRQNEDVVAERQA